MKHIESESNIPQIPERIIVKGDRAQKRAAQSEGPFPDVREEMYEYRRYAKNMSPAIIGCLSRK
jgi:hypothetical protein